MTATSRTEGGGEAGANEAHALPLSSPPPAEVAGAPRTRSAGPPRPKRRASDVAPAPGSLPPPNEPSPRKGPDETPAGAAAEGTPEAHGRRSDAPAALDDAAGAGRGEAPDEAGGAAQAAGGEAAGGEAAGGEWGPHQGPLVGSTVEGRYLVEALIGVGNIGLVYRARHKIIGKTVAIKVLRPDFARDHEVSERFLVEARAASVVDNPHVVDIDDFGELPDGTAYFVMEYLDGRPLSDVIRDEAPLSLERIIHVGKQIAAGLAAAHRSSIVHRDLKPDNLLVTRRGHERDFVTVVDFGIAKVAGATNRLTVAGTLYGTPHYMSPEQARGDEVDLRSDIYSLGVILYEMATGQVPFDADSPFAVVSQHVNAALVPPHLARPEAGISLALSELIVKCLSKSPADRFASMADVSVALERVRRWRPGALDTLPDVFTPATSVRPAPSVPPPTTTPAGRSRWPLALAVVTAAAAGAFVYRQRHAPLARPAPPAAAPAAAPPSAAPASPPPTAPHPDAAASASAASPPPAEPPLRGVTEVALVIAPIDAHVYHQKVDLGAMPISIPVPSGQTVDIEIKHVNYATRKIKLDGSKPKLVVRLVPLSSQAAAQAPPPHGPEEGAKDVSRSAPRGPDPGPMFTDVPEQGWPNEAADPKLPALPPPR
jgi:serine/threonine-protein kinase